MRESLVRPIVASILMWSSFDLANAADMPVKAPPPAKPARKASLAADRSATISRSHPRGSLALKPICKVAG